MEKMKRCSCLSCGAPLKVDPRKDTVTCSYCGASYPITQFADGKDVAELRRGEIRNQQMKDRRYILIQKEILRQFLSGKYAYVLLLGILFSLVFLLLFAQAGMYPSACICGLQALLLTGAFCIGMQMFPRIKFMVSFLPAIAALLLLVPLVILSCAGFEYEGEPLDPAAIKIENTLPAPDPNYVVVDYNTDTIFRAFAYRQNEDSFQRYARQCRLSGYDQDFMQSRYIFHGCNPAGSQLYLTYSQQDRCIYIDLDAPDPGK